MWESYTSAARLDRSYTTAKMRPWDKMHFTPLTINFIFVTDSSTIASDEETEAEDSTYASLEMFLAAFGLYQYVQKFKDEQIDLDALMLLTESDLQALRLPIGPHRKLVTAIQDRKQALSHTGPAL